MTKEIHSCILKEKFNERKAKVEKETTMIKAIFFDIDGTLVSFRTHEIPDSTKRALRALKEKGIKLFIATGRSPAQLDFFEEQNVRYFDGFITMNGQYCYNEKEVIREQCLDRQDLIDLLPYLEKNEEIGSSFVELDYVYFNRMTKGIQKMWDSLGKTAPKLNFDSVERVFEHKTYQLSTYIPEEEEEAFFQYMPNCKSARWHPDFMDVIPKDGGKTVGIQAVCQYYGIEQDEIMAFGDGGNDKEMLQYVKIGIAMGNAKDDVKEMADFVTKDVDEDGIEFALKHFGVL